MTELDSAQAVSSGSRMVDRLVESDYATPDGTTVALPAVEKTATG